MINDAMVDVLAAIQHVAWMESKRAQGFTSRKGEDGEEYMVPYFELSEKAKDLDRTTARSTLETMDRLGYKFVAK